MCLCPVYNYLRIEAWHVILVLKLYLRWREVFLILLILFRIKWHVLTSINLNVFVFHANPPFLTLTSEITHSFWNLCDCAFGRSHLLPMTHVEVWGILWCSVDFYLPLVWYCVFLLLTVEFTRPTLKIFSNNDCIYRICSNLLSIFQLKQVLTVEMFSLSYHFKTPLMLLLCIRIKGIHLFTFLMWMHPWCLLMLVSSYSTCLTQVNLHCVSCF